MIKQLNPPIPVRVTSHKDAKGVALGWIDYSVEHHLIWIIACDITGEIWLVPNHEIRMQSNWTMERRYAK